MNFNWQVWDTKAFSLYSRSTDRIDPQGAELAVSAVCRFLARMNVITDNVYGGYESTVLLEEELLTVKSQASGLFVPLVRSFTSVEKGQPLANIIDPLSGEIISQAVSPDVGIIFFAKDDSLVMENEILFKIVGKLHK